MNMGGVGSGSFGHTLSLVRGGPAKWKLNRMEGLGRDGGEEKKNSEKGHLEGFAM